MWISSSARAKSSYNSWIISWESYCHLCYCRNLKACQKGKGSAEAGSRGRGVKVPCVLERHPRNIPTGVGAQNEGEQLHFKCVHKPGDFSSTPVAAHKVAQIALHLLWATAILLTSRGRLLHSYLLTPSPFFHTKLHTSSKPFMEKEFP